MHLHRRTVIQLAIFLVVALVAGAVMFFGYFKAPVTWFGAGRYQVTVQLPQAGGLYKTGNVTYRGTEVGRVTSVHLTDTGVEAVLSLRSDLQIPSDVQVQVHSVSAVGEQYVALIPRSAGAPALKNGDVIPVENSQVPPDINRLLDAANRGLQAIPHDNLKTVIDESYTAVGGLGPEISRLVKGTTQLAIDARANLDALTTLIDQSQPVLDSQTQTSDEISSWARHMATITGQLHDNDTSVAGLLERGPAAAQEARELIDRLRPTVPVLLANLVSMNTVAIAYQPAIEQLLVLLPAGTAEFQGMSVPNMNTNQAYEGLFLDFNLNLNVPAPCNTGFLPIQQQRPPTFEDKPDLPPGDLYCRIPKDSPIAVRGARNFPCLTVPGKRAPTVKMCESNEQYVPLNDGNNWKGDPNATLSGQDIPQLPSATAGPSGTPSAEGATGSAPPLAVTNYDPATGTYIGPDGHIYTQADLAQQGQNERTWQSMLMPPTGN
ncbi:MlaD family protein [Mycobacterium sp. CVI_P3]|uniref:MlaD family protein n=1 Tax=Mycobacterium pinniadriaticum TaxID=2994102 RepID=A0ABT3SML3_9MYCO|nr:MlaD family protein [Mycobacterium pinniadriaticum]MCX2933996.1 MlaD family protein [Mycobacterium pinniadriaticum]MCX2940408.1 MlaD family protein [Mycobacterium pinniadriaticum]